MIHLHVSDIHLKLKSTELNWTAWFLQAMLDDLHPATFVYLMSLKAMLTLHSAECPDLAASGKVRPQDILELGW